MITRVMVTVLAGVFFGAFASEVMSRKKPGLVGVVLSRTKLAAGDFSRAFVQGYRAPRLQDGKRPTGA